MKSSSSGVLPVTRECWQLIQSWWKIDRIRASPVDGELLRLPVASVLRLDGRTWTVTVRWVCEDATGPFVRYQCRDENDTACLEVRPSPPFGTGGLRWTTEAEPSELHPAEIEVYAIGP